MADATLRQRPVGKEAAAAAQANGGVALSSPVPGRVSVPPTRFPGLAAATVVIYVGLLVYLAQTKPTMLISVGVLFLFLLCNFMVPPCTRVFWPGFKSLSAFKAAKFVNLAVSLTHSSISSVLCVAALVTVWDEYYGTANWIRGSVTSFLPFLSIAFSNGYFAYDTWDMLQNGMATKAPYLMLHHFALLFAFTLGCYLDLAMVYGCWCMLCEFNSVFLHLRVLLEIAGHTRENSFAYRLSWWFLLFTMYTTRLCCHTFLLVHIVMSRPHWSSDFLWCTCWMTLSIFCILNYFLNKNVSKAYQRMRQTKDSKRVIAIDVLASWVWPIIAVLVGLFVCVFVLRGSV